MQSDLHDLSEWLNINKLLLNVRKTKSILFSRHINDGIELYVNNQKIECVICFKMLGFYIDASLTFVHHAYLLRESLLTSLFLIRKLSTFIPKSGLKSLYYVYYFSRLNYGINVWLPLLWEEDKNKLFALQKRIIRIINCKSLMTHCMLLFKITKALTVHDMVKLENVKLVFKVVHNCAPRPVANLFSKF